MVWVAVEGRFPKVVCARKVAAVVAVAAAGGDDAAAADVDAAAHTERAFVVAAEGWERTWRGWKGRDKEGGSWRSTETSETREREGRG